MKGTTRLQITEKMCALRDSNSRPRPTEAAQPAGAETSQMESLAQRGSGETKPLVTNADKSLGATGASDRFRPLTRRLVYNPLRKLVGVTRTFALADGHRIIAPTSTAPKPIHKIDRLCSPAIQYPVAALKHRIALVHPLPHAAGLLTAFSMLCIVLQ